MAGVSPCELQVIRPLHVHHGIPLLPHARNVNVLFVCSAIIITSSSPSPCIITTHHCSSFQPSYAIHIRQVERAWEEARQEGGRIFFGRKCVWERNPTGWEVVEGGGGTCRPKTLNNGSRS